MQAPVLTYPRFDHNASAIFLQADVSTFGLVLGPVLEQDGHVITYASQGLRTLEQQYSVMQKEGLAVALKQFPHYTVLQNVVYSVMKTQHMSIMVNHSSDQCLTFSHEH